MRQSHCSSRVYRGASWGGRRACRHRSALLSVGGSHFPSHAPLEMPRPDGVMSGRGYRGFPNLAGSSWPGNQPPLLDWVLSPRKTAEAPPWQGGGWVEDQRGMGEKPKGRKRREEGGGVGGRGNSRLCRANESGRTRWYQIPIGQ